MAQTGHLVTVRRVKNCPLGYKPGDRMYFALPGVLKEDSDQVCALAIPDILPIIGRVDKAGENKAKAAEIGRSQFCTACKAINAFIEFDVVKGPPPVSGSAQDTGSIADPAFLEILRELKEFKVFAGLPTSSLVRFLPSVKRREIQGGDKVMEKGHRGDHLWLLTNGTVEVITTDAKGIDTVIASLGRGEVFGEMSLLTGEPVAATIRCSGTAKFLTIEKNEFERLLAHNPALNMYFTKLLAERLKNTSKRFMAEIEKGVLGYLSMIASPELMQALQATSRSGILHAKEDEKAIELYLHEGAIYRITPGGELDSDPEEAFYDFLTWRKGTFRFEPGVHPGERTFFKETTSLLLEGMRRVDEAAGAAAEAAEAAEA
jgi:CRP/FNR family cyclic AMP-dependent transcriptional regulator